MTELASIIYERLTREGYLLVFSETVLTAIANAAAEAAATGYEEAFYDSLDAYNISDMPDWAIEMEMVSHQNSFGY